MKLLVRLRHIDTTPGLHELVGRRVRFALARFGDAIREVHVTLSDENGPRGGIDKRCRVRITGDRVGAFVIESSAIDVVVAIDEALGRAGRTAARALHRRRVLGSAA